MVMTARCLGLLMLDTRFPRLPGDVGHAASWRLPVLSQLVPGAAPSAIVQPSASLQSARLPDFIRAALALQDAGVRAITTSCGFLVRWQAPLQAALRVPIWSSSLLALPGLLARGERPAVLTVDARSLDVQALVCAGVEAPMAAALPIGGLDAEAHLQRVLLDDLPQLDAHRAQADLIGVARGLQQRHPDISCWVLECTNLPPYEVALRHATGLPVHHLMSFVHEQWENLA